jgi:hypothetical protein
MKLTLISPTRAYISQATNEELESLREQLSYVDLSIKHEIKRLSKNHWFRTSNPQKYEITIKLLKEKLNCCLVFEDGPLLYIRPGNIPYLEGFNLEIDNQIVYPKPKKLAWFRPISYELYDYQKQSVEKLIHAKHGNVSITTGGGKSNIALSLCRETGLRTAIIAPSKGYFQ